MELLKQESQLAKFIYSNFKNIKFELNILDLGCSGGPDQAFKNISELESFHVNYVGIDLNSAEIFRLNNVYDPKYFKFYGHRIESQRSKKNGLYEKPENFWDSFSASEGMRNANVSEFSEKELVDFNFWSKEEIVKSETPIDIKTILRNYQRNSNLLKIDVDGPDFDFLRDFFEASERQPEFVSIEISYQGNSDSDTNTFHNTDRYLKSKGYTLVGLTNRTYSNLNFPKMFQYNIFAQTEGGIPFQGDAVYFKRNRNYEFESDALRDVVLLDLFNLEDLAVEIIKKIGAGSSHMWEKILDKITQDFWQGKYKTYEELMSTWKADPKKFFKVEKTILSDQDQAENQNLAEVYKNKIRRKLRNLLIK